MASTLNQRARALVKDSPLEAPALRFMQLVKPEWRRDATDDRNLDLLLAFSLRAGSNCIDIGCNRGGVLAELVRLAPKGTHFAFEPLPALAAELRTRFPGVTVNELALSNESGKATFTHVVDAAGFSGLHDRGLGAEHETEQIEVELARLDDVLPADYAPDLIKVDVEGAELQVFQGAAETLRRHRPTLWFEHGHIASGYFGATSYDIWDLLVGDIGYRLFNADGDGPLGREEFFKGPGRPMWNFVAH